MTDAEMNALLAAYRRIFVAFCGNCHCYEPGVCYRTLTAVKPWGTCEEWGE